MILIVPSRLDVDKADTMVINRVKQVWSVLHDIDDIPIDGLNEQQRQQVQTILQGCQEVLDELKAKLDKSHILAYTTPDWKTRARQAWKRITWDQTDIDRFRDRITSAISLFNLLMGRINQSVPPVSFPACLFIWI